MIQGLQSTKTYYKFNVPVASYANHIENVFPWYNFLSKHTKLWCMSCRRSNYINFVQKQSSRDVLRKRCSENTRQIYRRTSLLKCHFNKVALQLYWNHTSAEVVSLNLLHIFRILFYKNNSGGLLLFVIENPYQ